MTGKWLPGRAGEDAAGPAAGGEAQQPRAGSHGDTPSQQGHARCQSQVFGISHLRISQHSANSQQDVSFRWRAPHVSSRGYTKN